MAPERKTGMFGETETDVEILNGLARRTLEEIVNDAEQLHPACPAGFLNLPGNVAPVGTDDVSA